MRDSFDPTVPAQNVGGGIPPAFGDEISQIPARELFDENTRAERRFGGKLGCRQGPSLQADEVARIRELIKARLVYNAHNLNRKQAGQVVECDLQNYHTVAPLFDHQKMLCKAGRILGENAVDEIRSMSIFDYFKEGLGDFELADEDNVGHGQVCFRVVRPNVREDVGSLHCDSWFWEFYKWPTPAGQNRLKVWIPICIDEGRNGLIAVPESHRESRPYRTVQVGHKIGFEPEFDIRGLDYRMFDRPEGASFIFNYHLLHVGALNTTPTSRVSIEFTVLY